MSHHEIAEVVCDVYAADYRLADAAVHHTLIRHGPMTSTDAEGRFSFRDVPRERTILSIYGDPILPRITPLSELGDPETLEISVRGRYHLQVILEDAAAADAVGATDENGRRVGLSVIRSGSHNDGIEMPLRGGRSGVLAVGGATRNLLLLKEGEIVGEIPVALVPGETTVVRR